MAQYAKCTHTMYMYVLVKTLTRVLCVKYSMIELLRGQDGIKQNPVLYSALWNAYICNTPDTFTVICNKYSTGSCFDSPKIII